MKEQSGKRLSWVTGAGGFIGATVARALRRNGDRVVGFVRGTSPAAGIGELDLVEGGLTQPALERAIDEFGQPDRVFHFAGGSTVGASFADPMADFESNVATTARLLDAVRRFASGAPVVLASSAAVYGSGHDGAITTQDTTDPLSPYGHHKLMAEALGRAYAQSYDMRITVLRLFSVYGAGIRKQLVHDLCRRLEQGEASLVLGGTGAERRDWCHVEDVATLCVSLDPAPAGSPAVFNVGNATATDIATVARTLVTAWGDERSIRFSGDRRLGDPFSLVAARESLPPGFAPAWTLDAGVQDYVSWFRGQAK